MDYILNKFLPRIKFDSYEDFKKNFTINVPEDFNFGYDVVDAWAEAEPEKRALVWCNDHGEEKIFTFTDVKHISNKMCNYFKSIGLKKGDKVIKYREEIGYMLEDAPAGTWIHNHNMGCDRGKV